MEKKIAYCPICDKDMYMITDDTFSHCPVCNHRLSLHPFNILEKSEELTKKWESEMVECLQYARELANNFDAMARC